MYNGQSEPPEIPTGNIKKTHVIMYAGEHDDLLSMEDARRARDAVPGTEEFIELKDTNHSI